MRRWTLALALAAGAWLGLSAREEKAADELALVPASARVFFVVRPADAWASDLGKEVRKALGKDMDGIVKHVKDNLGAAPDGIERATFFVTALQPDVEGATLVRCKEKIDPDVPGRITRGGTPEKVGGQTVYVNRNMAAFLKDGKILVVGTQAAVRAMLEPRGKRSEAQAAALKRASGKHTAVAYVEPGLFPVKAEAIPLTLAFVKPFLTAKHAVAWGDMGDSVKLGAVVEFADEAGAGRGQKSLEAARKIGIAALASLGDELAKGPKEFAEVAEQAEKSLEKATIKKDGASVSAALEVNVGKAPLIAMMKQAADRMRMAAARMRSQNNLRQIGVALHSYHDANGTLPPQAIYDKDGKALLSWRVLILPYIEQDALYKEFRLNEPWDSAHNKKLLAKMPPTYAAIDGKNTVPHGTFYQVFFGKSAMFEGKRGIRITDITDGTSNTLMVAEAAKDVPWTKPDDLPFDDGKDPPKLGGLFEEGFNALFGDGSVRFMARAVKKDTLKALITRNGGEVVNDF